MSYVVTLLDYTPAAREDGLPWTSATIGEAPASNGPFSTIDTVTFTQPDADPSNPQARSFTTAAAQLPAGWYLVTFLDASGAQQPTVPVEYPPPAVGPSTPYCSVLDVQSRNAARPVTGSSVPNIAQVQGYIGEAAAEINAILVNKGYEVPVNAASAPDAFDLLHSLNVTGAWAMTEAAAPTSPNLDRATKAWTAAKEMLGDAKFVLNAPQDVERSEPRGPYLTSQPTGQVFDPMFRYSSGTADACGRGNPANPYFSRQQRF